MNDLVFCIYHSVDPDGYCSAAIVKKKYNNVIFLPYNYEENYNFLNRIPNESLVYVVDVSFPNMIFRKLKERMNLVWIDHHDTAIEESKLDGEVSTIKGIRQVGISASKLTYQYLYPQEEVPYAIEMINAYDIYDESYFPEAIIFNYFLQTKNIKISNITYPFWEELFEYNEETVNNLIDRYKVLHDYIQKQNEITAKSICYEAYINNYKCIVANRSRIGSDFFKSVVTEEHDIMVAMHITKKGDIKYTFYANKEDIHVGNLAKELATLFNGKGGGHIGAAGLVINKLLFPNRNLTTYIKLPDTEKGE